MFGRGCYRHYEDMEPGRVYLRKAWYRADGTKEPCKKSSLVCIAPECRQWKWRTSAKYVDSLPDYEGHIGVD